MELTGLKPPSTSETPATPARTGWVRHAARLGALLMALAVLVHAPSLGAGAMADDFGIQLVLDGRVESPTWKPWSLYDFGTLSEAPDRTVEAGAFPWWTDSDWRVRFFRPITSLSLWLDHALFGASPFAGHAMSLALFALLLFAARRLYVRLGLSTPAALLGVLILAFDNSALMPVGWVANRNSLLEGLFAVLAVHAGLEVVARPALHRAIFAFALATLAVGAKESGLHVFLVLALIFAREGKRGSHAHFFRGCAIVSVACAALYTLWYARSGMGSNVLFYPMPWTSPLEFAQRTLTVFACAPIAAVTPFSIDVLMLEPSKFWQILGAGVTLGVPVVVILLRRLRQVPNAAFLLIWGVLALLPQAGAPSSDRLMFTPMIAWSALVAMYFSATLAAPSAQAISPVERRFFWTIAATSTLLSALVVVMVGTAVARGCGMMRDVIRHADVGEEALGTRDVFLMQASPSTLIALSPLSVWTALGGSEDVRFHVVQGGRRTLDWTRLAENTFSLESLDEPFLSLPFEDVFLTRELRPAERVWTWSGFTVRATPGSDGKLRRVVFELATSLDDPRWRFLVFDGERLAHRPPPAIGETLRLERGFKDPFLP